jgi:hypothetical protein
MPSTVTFEEERRFAEIVWRSKMVNLELDGMNELG